MFIEALFILAILGIFVIVARKIPEAIRGDKAASSAPAPSKTPAAKPETKPNSLSMTWAKFLAPVTKSIIDKPAPEPAPVEKPLSDRELVLSDESLLREGDQYLESGKLKEAERSYLRGVAKNPKNPKLYNRLGAIYLKQRNYRDALEAFEAAREFDPSRSSRHYNIALAAWHLGNRSKAREAISQAISLDPSSAKYQQLKQQIEQS